MIAAMRERGTTIYGLWADVHGTPEDVRRFRQGAAVTWWKGSEWLGRALLTFLPSQYRLDGLSADPYILPEPLDRETSQFGVDAPCVADDCEGDGTIFTRVVAFLGGAGRLREDVCLYFYAWPFIKSDDPVVEKL